MRTPDDDACEAMLVDHEAERQDLEARIQAHADEFLPQLVQEATKALPSKERLAKLRDLVVRAYLLALGEHGNDLLRMVDRQARERREMFAKRSGVRLMKEPITKKRIEERAAAIEAARKVESDG